MTAEACLFVASRRRRQLLRARVAAAQPTLDGRGVVSMQALHSLPSGAADQRKALLLASHGCGFPGIVSL